MILKKGSRGIEVGALQGLLGIEPDGIFGPVTEKAVRDFQSRNGLVVDGVVGPKTWEALTPTRPPDDGSVVQRRMHEDRIGAEIVPRGVIWHYTAMLPETEMSLVRVWQETRGKGNGATFLIRRNGQIIQLCDLQRNSNHAGGGTTGWIYLTGNGEHPSDSAGTHPNTFAVGVELSNPGRVRRLSPSDSWFVAYNSEKPELPSEGCPVVTDKELGLYTKSDKWGWVDYTPEQYASAKKVVALCLEAGIQDEPCLITRKKVKGKDYGEVSVGSMRIGHCDVDPSRKDDPGPLWKVGNLFDD